jgi:hypothetical protein
VRAATSVVRNGREVSPRRLHLVDEFGGMVSVNPYIYPKMSFDPIKDLEPVAAAARVLVFLVTSRA